MLRPGFCLFFLYAKSIFFFSFFSVLVLYKREKLTVANEKQTKNFRKILPLVVARYRSVGFFEYAFDISVVCLEYIRQRTNES